MKKIIQLTLLSIALSSCTLTDQSHFEITPELMPSVNIFYKEAEKRNFYVHHDNLIVQLTTNLKDNGNAIFGLTTYPTYFNIVSSIQIDRKFCESLFSNETKRDSLTIEYVLFHEFGHFMGRTHDDSKPSIMSSTGLYSYEYSTNDSSRTALINELFTH